MLLHLLLCLVGQVAYGTGALAQVAYTLKGPGHAYIGGYKDLSTSPLTGWSWSDGTPATNLNCGSTGCTCGLVVCVHVALPWVVRGCAWLPVRTPKPLPFCHTITPLENRTSSPQLPRISPNPACQWIRHACACASTWQATCGGLTTRTVQLVAPRCLGWHCARSVPRLTTS